MSNEDAMQVAPTAARRNLFSRMPVIFGAATISSAALGLLLGYALFSPQQNRIPLDEWQPFVGQKQTVFIDADPPLYEKETTAPPDGSPGHTAPREHAFSIVRQFSDLLHIPASKISTNEHERQRVPKEMANRPAKPIARRHPSPVRTAPERPPDTSTPQVTEQAPTEPAKDQDADLMQRSYRAIATGAKSFGSLAGAAWDRIKP